MLTRPGHKKFVPFFLITFFLAAAITISSALAAQSSPFSATGSSSIEICFETNGDPGPVTYAGDLGDFTLIYPDSACYSAEGLDAGTYTITETLPEGWYPWMEPKCWYKGGSYYPDYQSTWLSVTVELAADSDASCEFISYEDPNEPNDIMAQATQTAYGSVVHGYLSPHPDVAPKGDRDFYGFFGYEGDELFIDAELFPYWDSPYIPWLILLDAENKTIAQAEETGSPQRFLKHKLPYSGMYYLVTGSPCTIGIPNCMGRASMGISISDRYEPNNSPDTATPIKFGDTLRASIKDNYYVEPAVRDDDYYRFQGSKGDKILIEVNRLDWRWDHVCHLLDGNGMILASQTASDCLLQSALSADGSYFIKVSLNSLCYSTLPCAYELKLQNINKPPLANPDSYKALSGETLHTSAPGVLGNDSDPEDDPLTAVLVSGVQHGILDLKESGAFTYTPKAGYTGDDSFQYCASDGRDESNHAKVSITITKANLAPTSNPDTYQTPAGQILSIGAPGILKNDGDADGDPLTAVLTSDVQHGSLNLAGDGSFTYKPDPGFVGQDAFQYHAFDGRDPSAATTVTIYVTHTLYLPAILDK